MDGGGCGSWLTNSDVPWSAPSLQTLQLNLAILLRLLNLQYSFEVLDFFTGSPSCVLFSHWFPSSHTTFLSCLSSFSRHFPNDFVPFTFQCFFQSTTLSPIIFPLLPVNSFLLTNFSLTLPFHPFFPCFSFTSPISTSTPPRAAVPGRAPPVQAAAGSRGRVLLRELPVRPPEPWLCSHRGRAPTWRWGHCRGYWETALPNGGYMLEGTVKKTLQPPNQQHRPPWKPITDWGTNSSWLKHIQTL